jgi:hypothetical protein
MEYTPKFEEFVYEEIIELEEGKFSKEKPKDFDKKIWKVVRVKGIDPNVKNSKTPVSGYRLVRKHAVKPGERKMSKSALKKRAKAAARTKRSKGKAFAKKVAKKAQLSRKANK